MPLKVGVIFLISFLLLCHITKGHTWPRCLDWEFNNEDAYKDASLRRWYKGQDSVVNVQGTDDGDCKSDIINQNIGKSCAEETSPKEVRVRVGEIICMTWLARNHFADTGYDQNMKRRTLDDETGATIYASSIDISIALQDRNRKYNMPRNRISTLNYRDCPIDSLSVKDISSNGQMKQMIIPGEPSENDLSHPDNPTSGAFNMKCGGCFTIPEKLPDGNLVNSSNHYVLQWTHVAGVDDVYKMCFNLKVSNQACGNQKKCGDTGYLVLRSPFPKDFGCSATKIALEGDTFANISPGTSEEKMKEFNPHILNELKAGDFVNIPPCKDFWDGGVQMVPSPVNVGVCPVNQRFTPGVFFMEPYLRREIYNFPNMADESDCAKLCEQLTDCDRWSWDPSGKPFSCFTKTIGNENNAVARTPDIVSGCISQRVKTTRSPTPPTANQNAGEGELCNAFNDIFCSSELSCIEPGSNKVGYVGKCGTVQQALQLPGGNDLPFTPMVIGGIVGGIVLCLLCACCCSYRLYIGEKRFLEKVLEQLPDGTILPSRK